MSLISLDFLIFFVIVCTVYYLLPGRAQWVWLLLASLVFYYGICSYTIPGMIAFVLIVFVNWAGSQYMGEDCDKRRTVFCSVLVFDIAALAFFKYTGFLYETAIAAGSLFGLDLSNGMCNRIVYLISENCPERISFFALIIIAYITDVYWGKSKAIKNPGKTMLFMSYFPLMTSGPIVRINQMEGQLWGDRHVFSYEKAVRGCERILFGVFKKIVISSRCAVIADLIYGQYEVYSGLYIIFGTVIYAIQLYTDFSGLMDIVLGVSECLGIELPENFKRPFFSKTIAEFWRRWHITLGAFLKDYVLFSIQRGKAYKKLRQFCKDHLGKDYKKKYNIPAYISLLISWFLIGLWHGGGWNYIFGVGIYMWFIIVLSDLLSPFFAKITKLLHINTECFSFRLFQSVRTFILYMFGLSFFRAASLREGFAIWRSALSDWNPWILFNGALYELGLDRQEMGILLLGVVIVLITSIISEKEGEDVRDWLGRQNYLFRLLVVVLMFAAVITWGHYGLNFNSEDFIYGRF